MCTLAGIRWRTEKNSWFMYCEIVVDQNGGVKKNTDIDDFLVLPRSVLLFACQSESFVNILQRTIPDYKTAYSLHRRKAHVCRILGIFLLLCFRGMTFILKEHIYSQCMS